MSQDGQRADKALAALLPDVSRTELQRWIAEGRVRVGGEAIKTRARLAVGDVVELDPPPPALSSAQPDPSVELDIVFEDEHLVVVHKPAGLVVHPGAGHPTGTLVNGLLARAGFDAPTDPLDNEGHLRPGIVHRLDKDTSGLLVVAKDAKTREGLKAQLAEHSVEREYRAITRGAPRAGRIETLHGRHPTHRQRFSSRVARGKSAVTHVEVVERLAQGRAALVSCRLETGRTHQIRVHLLEQTNTPILGDVLYASPPRDKYLERAVERLGRQALHAGVLGFVHPISEQRLRFEAPLPDDMQGALELLRAIV